MNPPNSPLAISALQSLDGGASTPAGHLPPAPGRSESGSSKWFEEEIHPHEPALRNFLRSRFPGLTELDDLVQEAYARLFRARNKGKLTNAKSFLFSTARNTAVDWHRRKQARPLHFLADLETLDVREDRNDAAEATGHDQELELLHEAIASLPERCRIILTLRKIEQLPREKIARRLGISECTVNAQIQIGMMKCQRFFMERGLFPRTDR